MRHIILPSAACLYVPHFSTLSHKRHDFGEKVIEHVKFNLSETFLMLKRIEWDITINVHRSPCKVKKVKVTLVQALRFCTGRTAHRGSRGIALPFHDHGTRRGWGVSVMPRPLFTPEKEPVPIVQEAGWAPGPVWTGAENLAPTGIRSPDRPDRS